MIKTAERRRFVLTLRKMGWTYAKISAAVLKKYGDTAVPRGYDDRYAYKDVKRELDKLRTETGDDAEDIRDIEVLRLESMLEAIFPKALRGDYRAIDRAIKISERLSKLLGIDAPSKQEHSGPGGTPIQIEDVNETRQRLLESIQKSVARDDAQPEDGVG